MAGPGAVTARTVRAKVVMIGAPRVGKSSLVRRFVDGVFRDDLASTIGVKVDRATVRVDRADGPVDVTLLLWDVHGEAEGMAIPDHYLRGARGALAVFDLTRPDTAATALALGERITALSPGASALLIGNKADLEVEWDAVETIVGGAPLSTTSALTGEAVETAFRSLAEAIVA